MVYCNIAINFDEFLIKKTIRNSAIRMRNLNLKNENSPTVRRFRSKLANFEPKKKKEVK